MRVLRAAGIGCLLAAACTISCGIVQASDPVPPKAVVWIEPIADSGGADQKMGDGETLARRFTKGLRAALEGEAKERFEVRVVTKSALPPVAAPDVPTVRFVLRGGLSRAQSEPESRDPPPYLCIVRLFQESIPVTGAKPTRRLIGQWAGTARGLRDLTGNLARDPRVHVLGLAGELSRRISIATLRFADPATAAVSPPAVSPGGDNGNGPPAVLVLDGGTAAAPSVTLKPPPATK